MFAFNASRSTLLGGVRALSTSAVRNDLARMQVLGRLVADPEVRSTKNGKDFVKYTVASSDPSTAPADDSGERVQTTTFHRFYVFGERGVEKMKTMKKGYRVLVDADFRIERTPSPDGQSPTKETLLAMQRSIQVISKPKESSEMV